MSDLGRRLRQAREERGLSLSGLAIRTGFSKSYLGNVERGIRPATPAVIRAYEKALGEDVKRRSLLIGVASSAMAGTTPDVAVDVVRDISAERSKLLATVQTSHETDKLISALVSRDAPSVGSLMKWMRAGSPVLRVNAAGILAKVGSPTIDNDVVMALKADADARSLYLRAVMSRVLRMPWDDAGAYVAGSKPLDGSEHIAAFAAEACNPYDSGARLCSVVMLARARAEDRASVDAALRDALTQETSRENLRAIAATLAGVDPLTV
jgi:transcriptional regulator with XRE-family HTH domain